MKGNDLWQNERVLRIALAIGLLASLALNPSWLTAALLGLLGMASLLRRQAGDSAPQPVEAPAALPEPVTFRPPS